MGAAQIPMMNNVALPPQQAGHRQNAPINENSRVLLNTYIYEYFLRFGMNDCARTLLDGDHQVLVVRDGSNRRRDENGNVLGNGVGGDAMETDNKDDMDAKSPDDLPPPRLPKSSENTSFLHEWFCLFWDMYSAQRKSGNSSVHQYLHHTAVSLPSSVVLASRLVFEFVTEWSCTLEPKSTYSEPAKPPKPSARTPSPDAPRCTASVPNDAHAEWGHGTRWEARARTGSDGKQSKPVRTALQGVGSPTSLIQEITSNISQSARSANDAASQA